MASCKKCDGDGWIEVMDPHHYGAVVGVMTCPECDGDGEIDDFEEGE